MSPPAATPPQIHSPPSPQTPPPQVLSRRRASCSPIGIGGERKRPAWSPAPSPSTGRRPEGAVVVHGAGRGEVKALVLRSACSSCRLLPCDGASRTRPRACGPGCSGSLTSRHPTPPHLPLPLLVFSVPTPLRRPAPGLRKIRPWCDSVWPSRSQIRGCHTTGAAASPPRLPAATSMRSVDSFSPGISALLLSS